MNISSIIQSARYGLAVAGICLSVSCNKYLDIKPVDSFLDDQVFSNKFSVEAALNGVYLNLTKDNLYGANLSSTTIDAMAQYYNTSNTSHRLNPFTTHTYTNETAMNTFSAIWNDAYRAVLNLNIFTQRLANTQLPNFPETEKNILMGEAKGLKAMLMFDMLRLFGPIYKIDSLSPAIPYPSATSSETSPILTAQKVMDSVINDLNRALMYLENDPVRTDGIIDPNTTTSENFYLGRNRRMNYFAVKALLARTSLYRGNKAAALQHAKSLIAEGGKWFPWTDPNMSTSTPDRVFSSELIFAPENISLYNVHRTWFAATNSSSGSLLIPFLNPSLNADRLLDIYERQENDYRFKSWWQVDATATLGSKTFFKFVDPVTTINSNVPFRYLQPLIRISEMYLIAAESTTNADSAKYFINQMQFNRGLHNLENFTLATELEKAYQKEFWGEGQLFFFYKRINKPTIRSATSNTANVTMNAARYVVPLPLAEQEYR